MGFIRGGMIESFLAALGAVGILIGFILIVIARRGRRIDDHPICRKCGYDLTGRAEGSDRCAECGADLSRRRAIRVGNRAPRRPLFWAGFAMTAIFLLLTSAFVWVQLSQIDLIQHKPVWLLRSDASSLVAATRAPAVTELTRRFTAGELTDAQIQAIISDAIVFQANPNFPWTEWDGLLNSILLAGKISDADWVTFVRQAVKLKLVTRAKVRAGDPMPVLLIMTSDRLPWWKPGFSYSATQPPPPFIEVEWLEVQISGVKATNIRSRLGEYPSMNPSLDGVKIEEAQTAGLTEGVHRLTAQVRTSVLRQNSKAKLASFNVDIDADVTILPATTPTQQMFVSNPQTNAGMQNASWDVRVTAAAPGATSDAVVLQLTVSNPPAGLAHQAYLRTADGNEFAMGSISFAGASFGGGSRLKNAKIGPAASVDVILRPDFDLLKTSIRSDPVWGEEIIFYDVKVARSTAIPGSQRPTTTSRPGG